MKNILIIILTTLIISCNTSCATIKKQNKHTFDWSNLIIRLSKDGLDETYLNEIFYKKGVSFKPKVMPKKITHQEHKLNYAQFLEEHNINMAKEFIKNHQKLLYEVESTYGVPIEIQTAILLVETRLGTFLGNDLAIDILASMAISSNIEQIKPHLPPDYIIDDNTKKRIEKKSEWAYNELKALLIYTKENNLDPFQIKGSIFGAIGICQFMPSNILKFGVDYNNNNIINLFELEDAVASMANYLYHYGWRPGIPKETQEKVIMKYNPSRPYTETVLTAAKLLGWKGY